MKTDLSDAIKAANSVVFMTGAGVSTASGIPDYRSKGGLYDGQSNPEYLLSHENLQEHPASFYEFVKQNMYFPEAKPNVIHEKMAAITNQKRTIITQNVDGLDKKAGAKNVIEFHGDLYDIYCQKCHENTDYQQYLISDRHEKDGGIYRPDIVLYGESINPNVISHSVEVIRHADVIVVVGTSFQVYPFAGLIEYRDPKAQLFAVNEQVLHFPMPVTMIQGNAVDVFENLEE